MNRPDTSGSSRARPTGLARLVFAASLASLVSCARDEPAEVVQFVPVAAEPAAAPARPSVIGAWEFRREVDGAVQRLGLIVEQHSVRWVTHGQVTRESPARVRVESDNTVIIELAEASGEATEVLELRFVDGGIAYAAAPGVVYRPVALEQALHTGETEFAAAQLDEREPGEASGSGAPPR